MNFKRKIVFIVIASLDVIIIALFAMYKTNAFDLGYIVRHGRKDLLYTVLKLEDGATDTPACVPVLMYHSINNTAIGESDCTVKTDNFEKQMKYLSDNGYTTITFEDLKKAGNYKKPIMITFDDGYIDNYTNAYPILKRYNLKATIFVISNGIGAKGHMTEDQMKEMSDIISFQSHTVNHKPLSSLSEADVEKECSDSRDTISRVTNKPVIALSYPNGAFNAKVADTVSHYYDYAVTIRFGYYYSGDPALEIRRINIFNALTMDEFGLLVG